MIAARSEPLALRFQIGARTLASVRRRLVRVPLSLDEAMAGRLPILPALDRAAHGYTITSLPAARAAALAWTGGGMIAQVRQRYRRHYADLTIGFEAYCARLSPGQRSAIKRKTRRLERASGGALDIRRSRTPDELAAFHRVARALSIKTYQERLFGGGLPDDPAFRASMCRLAAAGAVRAWLLYVGGEPAAFLYCPVEHGVVRYDHVGHDPAFADWSPGSVLMLTAMRDLQEERGLRAFDFTEGDGQHKRGFATHSIDCVDMLLLRPTPAHHLMLAALGGFDRAVGLGKRTISWFGFDALAKRLRR